MPAIPRKRVLEQLSSTEVVKLATSGPTGIQMSACASRSRGTRLFVRLPAASEHLVNLETDDEVALTDDRWRLVGKARLCVEGHPFTREEARWHQVIVTLPARFEFLDKDGTQAVEAMDIKQKDIWEDSGGI
jgi:hypothetical protein